jgi:hypothetical protein
VGTHSGGAGGLVRTAPGWRHIDLASGRLAITESAEQMASGVRYKPPKSRRARTVALSATVSAEVRVHKARQAEELLGLGVRQSKDTFVYAREDGAPMQPRNLTRGLGASAEPDRVAVRSLSRSPSRACDAPSGQWRTSEGRL